MPPRDAAEAAPTPAAPTTKAGQRLIDMLAQIDPEPQGIGWVRDAILAIEAEAPSTPAGATRPDDEPQTYDEAAERVHRAFCDPDHEMVSYWDQAMADALRRNGYIIARSTPAEALEHDINCGIDPLRLGEDIGCTCGAEREPDDGCAFVGTFMGIDQRCDEPPYSDWHDPMSLSFKHAYEHDCGDCAVECPICGDGFDNHDAIAHVEASALHTGDR